MYMYVYVFCVTLFIMHILKIKHIIGESKPMDSEYSAITISLPCVKKSVIQQNTYLYELNVATRWSKWHLEKKYSEFKELHNFLSRQFNDLPEFPESMFSTYLGEAESDVEEYRDILEDYMRITSIRKDIINSEFYSQFLQLQKHSKALLVNKPKFEGEFQIEERDNDDGKIIIDLYYDEKFIVFATGNNSPLEKFNAVIANTRFPWEDDDDAEFILPLGTIECWRLKKKPYGYSRVWARNYPTEVKKFLFLPDAQSMVVGLSDGSVEIFKLIPKNNYLYYEVVKQVKTHEDAITGLHLDKINRILYSSSIDGFLNIIDARNGVLIDSLEMHCEITNIVGDSENSRLMVALGEGNMEYYEYDNRAKLRKLTSLSTPDSYCIQAMLFNRDKNYFFAAGFDSGSIYIYELPKPGQDKLMKQVGTLKNKKNIISLHFIPQKLELIVATQSGEVFFWDCVKGKQIYMLKPFEEEAEMGITWYLPDQRTLITAQRSRLVKFWSLPRQWRDAMLEVEEEREIEIRRKVENLYKVREAIKRKENDSDEDDLACWYRSDSSSSEEEGWFDNMI